MAAENGTIGSLSHSATSPVLEEERLLRNYLHQVGLWGTALSLNWGGRRWVIPFHGLALTL